MSSPAEEIAKLHELLVKGQLTQAEFEQGKAQVLGSRPAAGANSVAVGSRLRRSSTDYWLGGVCGGLGKVTGIKSWVWRLIATLCILLSFGIGFIAYLLLWIFVPSDT